MKKSLFMCICLSSSQAYGMSAVLNFLFFQDASYTSNNRATNSTASENRPEHWLTSLEEKDYTKALALLKKIPQADADSFALIYLARSSIPTKWLKKVLTDSHYAFTEKSFLRAMQTALRKGDLTLFGVLERYSTPMTNSRTELITVGRIDAAAGNRNVMKFLLDQGRKKLKEKALIEKRKAQNQKGNVNDDLPDDEIDSDSEYGGTNPADYSLDYLETIEKDWDLSRRLASPCRPMIWDHTAGKMVDRGTKQHSLPLQAAVDCNMLGIVILLLQYGAPIDAKDHDNETALHLARRKRYAKIEKILELFAHWKKKLFSVKDEKTLIHLIEECPALASCSVKDSEGNTLLHKAVEENFSQLIFRLHGTNPELVHEENNKGELPRISKENKTVSVACSTDPVD